MLQTFQNQLPIITKICCDVVQRGSDRSCSYDQQRVTQLIQKFRTFAARVEPELFAIHMACTWAITNVYEQSHIIILSDSQAAIMAINSTNTHSRVPVWF